jgi:predicted cupin superfamily sugar epimerase
MIERVTELIERLALQPHPERGWFAETYRAPLAIAAHGGTRAASTASTADAIGRFGRPPGGAR